MSGLSLGGECIRLSSLNWVVSLSLWSGTRLRLFKSKDVRDRSQGALRMADIPSKWFNSTNLAYITRWQSLWEVAIDRDFILKEANERSRAMIFTRLDVQNIGTKSQIYQSMRYTPRDFGWLTRYAFCEGFRCVAREHTDALIRHVINSL